MFILLFNRIIIISKKNLRADLKKAYDDGLNKGYELGYVMKKTEETNRGFIIGSKPKLDDEWLQQIDEIVKGKEF